METFRCPTLCLIEGSMTWWVVHQEDYIWCPIRWPLNNSLMDSRSNALRRQSLQRCWIQLTRMGALRSRRTFRTIRLQVARVAWDHVLSIHKLWRMAVGRSLSRATIRLLVAISHWKGLRSTVSLTNLKWTLRRRSMSSAMKTVDQLADKCPRHRPLSNYEDRLRNILPE